MEKKTDLRVERTYFLLRNAFTELLSEKCFEDFTVNELCERAMIRRTTFYKHFADKHEYFTFYLKEIALDFRHQIPSGIRSNDIHAHILHMSSAFLRFMSRQKKLVDHIRSSNMYPVLLDNLFEVIMYDLLDALSQTSYQQSMSDYQLENIAAFYAGGVLNTIKMRLKREKVIDEEKLLAMLEQLLIF